MSDVPVHLALHQARPVGSATEFVLDVGQVGGRAYGVTLRAERLGDRLEFRRVDEGRAGVPLAVDQPVVDGDGNVYVTGVTVDGFPTFDLASDYRPIENNSGYVVKYDEHGGMEAATYFGGSERDFPFGIDVSM
jgi:hypothetical protein